MQLFTNDLARTCETSGLNLGRIIGNFHFYIVPTGTIGVNISSYRKDKANLIGSPKRGLNTHTPVDL